MLCLFVRKIALKTPCLSHDGVIRTPEELDENLPNLEPASVAPIHWVISLNQNAGKFTPLRSALNSTIMGATESTSTETLSSGQAVVTEKVAGKIV